MFVLFANLWDCSLSTARAPVKTIMPAEWHSIRLRLPALNQFIQNLAQQAFVTLRHPAWKHQVINDMNGSEHITRSHFAINIIEDSLQVVRIVRRLSGKSVGVTSLNLLREFFNSQWGFLRRPGRINAAVVWVPDKQADGLGFVEIPAGGFPGAKPGQSGNQIATVVAQAWFRHGNDERDDGGGEPRMNCCCLRAEVINHVLVILPKTLFGV
jgi:hypothetical protein